MIAAREHPQAEALRREYQRGRADSNGEAPIPPLVLAALERYRDKGVKPGHFTTAVLCGNFLEAVGRADQESFAALRTIARWVYNDMPHSAQGSPEKVRAHLKRVEQG